jgi:hypothetical protein
MMMMTDYKSLEDLFGEELTSRLDLKFQKLDPEPVEVLKKQYHCSFCHDAPAVYVLEKVLLQVVTGRDLYTLESTSKGHAITCCMKDKNSDNDEYVAGACHMEIMHTTGQTSELIEYDVYWRII